MTNTHDQRATQHHGEPLPEAIQPCEGDRVRNGMEKSRICRHTIEYVSKRAASKARDKERAAEYKAAREWAKKVPDNIFNPNRYRCWMTGNGQKGQG